jgi:hypothetical protein
VVPGLNEAVQGSTCATSSSPRVSDCRSFACCADEPRKMRGLFILSPDCRSERVRGRCRRAHHASTARPGHGRRVCRLSLKEPRTFPHTRSTRCGNACDRSTGDHRDLQVVEPVIGDVRFWPKADVGVVDHLRSIRTYGDAKS